MFRRAFTLVELIVTVALISVLAAIAVSNFQSMQYRAKRVEVPTNLDGIKTAELAYEGSWDTFLEIAIPVPSASPSGKVGPATWPANSDFMELGWAPDGDVRGVYSVLTSDMPDGDFRVEGRIDVDQNGLDAYFTATRYIDVTFNNNNDTY